MDLFGLLWPGAAVSEEARFGAVAVVGAGGKTTFLTRLALEAASRGTGALLAVTTKWWNPPGFPGADHVIVTATGEPSDFGADPESGAMIRALSGPPTEDGTKVTGIDSGDLLRLMSPWRVTAPRPASAPIGGAAPVSGGPPRFALPIVIEADGARGRAIKVPGPGEPVVPSWVTTVVCVTAVTALGSAATEALVHRTDAYARLAGESAASVTPIVVARLMEDPQGMFKGTPAPARRVWIVNGAGAPAVVARARGFAESVLERFDTGTGGRPLPVDTIAVASLQSDDPVRAVVMDRS